MMRTTGYSLSITGQMQARGEVQPPGVRTPDECVPAPRYIAELAKRGVRVRQVVSEARIERGARVERVR
jgi:lysine 6-dehydrogenase